MLYVYDLDLKRKGVLTNAYNITENMQMNTVYTLSFALPYDDLKNALCKPFWYIRQDNGHLYRIITPGGKKSDAGEMTYECEHVIATLIDDVLFGDHVVGNVDQNTNYAINYVLEKQTVKRWILGDSEVNFLYEYGWQNENLLGALFSIANLFAFPYMWDYDTSTFPWRIYLKRIDASAPSTFKFQYGLNLLERDYSYATQDICTRLYLLGYGEGVNQLKIGSVNNGNDYLLADQSLIDEYGLITRIFTDQTIESAQTLKERGQVILDRYSKPQYSITVSAVDLYQETESESHYVNLGTIVRLIDDNMKTYVVGVERNHDNMGDMKVTLSTKPFDIVEGIADLANRQRIQEVYAQGATQLAPWAVQSNATATVPAELNINIPSEMIIINSVKVKIKMSSMRSYTQITGAGGGSYSSTEAGGEELETTETGGIQTETSDTNDPSTTTSYNNSITTTTRTSTLVTYVEEITGKTTISQDHQHNYKAAGSHTHLTVAHDHDLRHTHTVPTSQHRHTVELSGHVHKFITPEHIHDMVLRDHTHPMEAGIYKTGNPSTGRLFIDGVQKTVIESTAELTITDMLIDPETGAIPRDKWIEISVYPDDKAYITIEAIFQGFMQSRGGGTF